MSLEVCSLTDLSDNPYQWFSPSEMRARSKLFLRLGGQVQMDITLSPDDLQTLVEGLVDSRLIPKDGNPLD